MNELIPIQYDSENPTVSGRELHAVLEMETRYNDWFLRMSEYGFQEGKDFYSILSKSSGGRPGTDHAITIPMAKEIEKAEKRGMRIRRFNSQCEEVQVR